MRSPARRLLPLLLVLASCASTVDPVEEPPLAATAVDTRLLEGPAEEVVASGSMTFRFEADVAGATFECSLDGAPYAACTSPVTHTGLAEGAHAFQVRAVLADVRDETPALAAWEVDTTAPNAALFQGPTGTVASNSATFTFGSVERGATFECELDGKGWAPCESPFTYSSLAQGPHTFAVRARDGVGNVDPTPATRSWSVETLAAHASFTSGPSGTVASDSATFTFTANGEGTFECALDDEAFSPCTSPLTYGLLDEGDHRLQVRLVDALGVASAPDLRSWSVDTVAPETSLSAGPAEGATVASRTATFTFTASEASSTFECALDAAAFTGCTSPQEYTQLADGAHTFTVRARDAAGNVDASPTHRSWSVSAPTAVRLRLAAANITSGNLQSYDPGHGTRILQGLDPDVVMIQEFNYGDNSATAIRSFVDTAFGSDFHYYRESGAQIPNGIVSRWPILASGEWTDTQVSNRDFAWARIDVPGPKDLWAVSVHLLTSGSGVRNTEAGNLVNYIKANVPASDYLVIGGDLNTDSRSESCFSTFSQVVVTSGPHPADKNGNVNTNASRSKPYDHVLVDDDLLPHSTAVVIGSSTFTSGLVFDSRVYTPLSEVSPVQSGDSSATNMQHMAVVKDFLLPN